MQPEELFVGTMPVAQRQSFDQELLARYLSGHVEGFQGPLTVEQFKGGQSNPTFLLTTPTSSYVMRAKPGPVAKLLPSAHAIEREYRVQAALAKTDVPVAKMVCLCEDESVIGRAFYLMEHVKGRVLWNQALPAIERSQRADIYREMNRVIAALHSVNPTEIGLDDFGKAGNYFARQIGRWTKQYQASETEHIDAMNQLIQWLPEHIPDENEVGIVHGDYRLDNLIFDANEPRILAILDWELSTLGAPLADFSYHCMSFHIPPGQFRGIGGLDLQSLGIPQEHQYIQMYCEYTGRDMAQVTRHWKFYLAYNMFRLAAILQGIMKRVVDGTAASQQAVESGRSARPLAELGWNMAQAA